MLLALGAGQTWSQDDSPEMDPPDRAARLSLIEGDVAIQPAGEQAWAPAFLNRPLTTGDKLWTERDSHAEIQVARAAIRLDDDTDFSFLTLDNDTVQVRMTRGVLRVNVRALEPGDEFGIETPNLTVSLLQPGTYRVEVNGPGDTSVVKVSDGEAKAKGRAQNVIVRAGQVATFTGTDTLTAVFDPLGEPDEFDSWSGERERRDYLASTRSEFVSPDVTGYQDLEEYGTWSSEPEHGYVWTPSNVGVGWSPYSYGRWTWVSPWGWTWIDDAPWGYAPFHYGRWAHVRDRWCWVPGPRAVRAVYAPALVGWNRSRNGYVSWFPLGPGDAYYPDGRYSRRYVERVNLSNTQIVRRVLDEVLDKRARSVRYPNREVPGSVTTVPQETFTSAERVGNRRVRIEDPDFTRSWATTESPNIAPVIASRLGGLPSTRLRTPAPPNFDRTTIVKPLPGSSAPKRPPAVEPPAPESAALSPPPQPTQVETMQREMARRAVEQQRSQQQQQYREQVRRAQDALRQESSRPQPRVEASQPRVSQPEAPRVSQPAQPRVERSQSHRTQESRPAPAPRPNTPRANEPRAHRD